MARDVEGERLLEPDDGAEVVLVARAGQLLERLVGAGDVGGVVLVVVELHDLARHVGLQRGVVVGQIGKAVLGHGGLLFVVVVVCVLDHTRRGRRSQPGSNHHASRAGRPPGATPDGPVRRYACKSEHRPEGPLARPRVLHPRAARDRPGSSLRRLSELAGISNPYLSQIERGLRRPSAEILQQIAKALRISAETLYVQAGILEAPVGVARPDPGHPGRPDDQRGAEAGPRAHLPLVPARARGRGSGSTGPGRRRTAPARAAAEPAAAGPPAATEPPAARPGRHRLNADRHRRLHAGGLFPTAGRL